MAERPYFYIKNNHVCSGSAEFEWFPGFALSQKQKSIESFHRAIRKKNRTPLEVSTKSPSALGRKLSAFNLKLHGHYLENLFQASKVFSGGGLYLDLLNIEPKKAKTDERLKTSGRLVKFTLDSSDWPLEPKTVFYDSLYYRAVREILSPKELEEIRQYDAFTDIEFNPNRSINTQARSIAIVKLIWSMYDELPEIAPEEFFKLHKTIV